jgi:hypothetical protein
MLLDETFAGRNRASRARMRELVERLSDDELQTRVGEHFIPEIDIFVNDLSLPLWAAVPPRAAARIANETAETLDQRLEAYPRPRLEAVYDYNPRRVVRALHRNQHLDEAEAAVRQG